MKRNLIYNGIQFIVILLLFTLAKINAQEIGKSWEFNTDGNFEGITLSSNFQDSTVQNGYLSATVNKIFPSLSSEPFELNASEYGYIQIRLKIPGASSGKIMWYNDTGAWGYMQFNAAGDTSFQDFDIPVFLSNQWTGKITQIMRLDFNPTVGSQVVIDYIRIVRIGVKPTIVNFAPIRTVFKQNEEIPLVAIIKNNGDNEANIASKLILPDNANLISGELEKDHGILFKDKTDSLDWLISFNELGSYSVKFQLTDGSITTEKELIFNVIDKYWQQDKFLLSAWSPPYAWYGQPYEDEVFQYYKDANFKNALWVRPDDELISMVKKYNLKYFLLVTGILGGDKYVRSEDDALAPDLTEEMLLNLDVAIDKYKDDPDLIGYHICDEPHEGAFKNIGKAVQRIREKDPTKLSFVNIWPSGNGYGEYIDNLLQTTRLEILSYDRYHFYNGYDGGEYFSNIDIIRKYALKYKIPFCNIIQAIGTNGTVESGLNWRTPSEAEHRWLVYSSLTYGVHALIWFHWHGDWGLTGNPDREIIYPSIQNLNSEIDSLSQIMVNLNTTGVFHSKISEPKWQLPTDGIIKSVSENANLVIGYFNDSESNKYFMLMNKNYNDSVNASITLNGIAENLIYFNVQNNSWESIETYDGGSNTQFDVDLRAGGGKLFTFSNLTEADNLGKINTPSNFELFQNYPNPFNPVTKIKYQLSKTIFVKINFYDVLGRKIESKINKLQTSGIYEIEFDGSKYSSGIYYYRLEAGSYSQTKKMILLK